MRPCLNTYTQTHTPRNTQAPVPWCPHAFLCYSWLGLSLSASLCLRDWSPGIQTGGGGSHNSEPLGSSPEPGGVVLLWVGREQKQRGRGSLTLVSSPHSVSDTAQGGRVCPGTLLQPSFCLHREPYLWGEGGEVGSGSWGLGCGAMIPGKQYLPFCPDSPHQGGS